jgi:hypothetical protein
MSELFAIDDKGVPLRKVRPLRDYHRLLLKEEFTPLHRFVWQDLIGDCIAHIHEFPRRIRHIQENRCPLPAILAALNNYLTAPKVEPHFHDLFPRDSRWRHFNFKTDVAAGTITRHAPNHYLYVIYQPDWVTLVVYNDKVVLGEEGIGPVFSFITDPYKLKELFEQVENLLIGDA